MGPGGTDQDRCAHAGLVDRQLAQQLAEKNGYHFFYMPRADLKGVVTKYVLAADPVTPGTSGVRHLVAGGSASEN
jgi:hypothetical protein